MSLPGADLLMARIREIELTGRALRGEPSKEDMELARRAVEAGAPCEVCGRPTGGCCTVNANKL